MAKLLTLPMSSVEENPNALRTVVNKESAKYAELKAGIASVGLLSPISVREYEKEDGSVGYRLVDGLHRFTACGELGYDEIPVNVVDIEESRLLVAQITGNNNVPTSKSEFAQAIKQLIQHNGMTTSEVATLLSRPEKWVKDILGLADLPEEILKLVDEGKLVVQNALSLKKLPKDKLIDYVQAAMTEDPSTFGPRIEELAKELKSAALTGRKANLEFKPTTKVRKTTELTRTLEEYTRTGTVADLRSLIDATGVTDPVEAAMLGIQWVMQRDPVSEAAQRATWDAEQAAVAEAKAKKEKEKAAKKAAEAKKALEDAGTLLAA